ncbi:CAP domain-containing protein [Halobacillus halophilus]|uniref:CAP domain-containing protein n=1 Tax=Halobacillus halophilus TaxID=1570 RepID=UPI001CD4AC3F|nr:CAP domain-containing protein [Halobacillus halophilus]MCA1012775.1 CAP domain-containing protein [Halobacillus halophilus]
MIKKLLLVIIVAVIIGTIAAPSYAQEIWENKDEHLGSVTEKAHQVGNWFSDWDASSPLIEELKKYFGSGEMPEPEIETSPAPVVPEDNQNAESAERSGEEVNKEQADLTTSSLKDYEPSEYEKEVVALVNEERAAEGLKPLEMFNRLSGLAVVKSEDMAEKNYFSHTSPTYGSPFEMMDEFDFSYWAAGENIAAGQRTPEEVVEGWMNSEGHRANILNDQFTHIGVGYIEDSGKYGTYWTQLFMKPR